MQDLEFDLRFCEDMIHKERLHSKKLKHELSTASNRYDELYLKAKQYILNNPNEKAKIA